MSIVRVCPRCSSETPRGHFACTECGKSLRGVPEIDLGAPPVPVSPTDQMADANPLPPTRSVNFTVITGVDIPFGELVLLMVKIRFAAIPAVIILGIAWAIGMAIIGAMLTGSAGPW